MDEVVRMEEGGSQEESIEAARVLDGRRDQSPDGRGADVSQREENTPLIGLATSTPTKGISSIEQGEERMEEEVKAAKDARDLIGKADKEKKLITQFFEIKRLCDGETDFNENDVVKFLNSSLPAAKKKLTRFQQKLCSGDGRKSKDEVKFPISNILKIFIRWTRWVNK